jgi:hypothetical protein
MEKVKIQVKLNECEATPRMKTSIAAWPILHDERTSPLAENLTWGWRAPQPYACGRCRAIATTAAVADPCPPRRFRGRAVMPRVIRGRGDSR